jgi:putative PIN family toxin of toxin-antitoxin system
VRVVFDTNVLVAAVVAEGLCREIVETHVPQHQPILSLRLWDELVETLDDRFGLQADALPILALYRRHATWTDPPPLDRPVSRGPDDDWVLATAIAGQAEAIVTGDDDLLCLGEHAGVSILTPRQFIERLQTG